MKSINEILIILTVFTAVFMLTACNSEGIANIGYVQETGGTIIQRIDENTLRVGQETFKLNETDFWGYYRLSLWHSNIDDLSALEDITHMQQLILTNNQISDISPLRGLVNLVELNLDRNQISEISPLQELANLVDLRLSDNQISDISPLRELVNLNRLQLCNNQIDDISILCGLTNLNSLTLQNNQIKDVSVLSELTNLRYLDISNNQISDVYALSGLVNLNTLIIYGNPISQDQVDALRAALPDCNITYLTLAGTSWELVQINGSDGTVRYTRQDLHELGQWVTFDFYEDGTKINRTILFSEDGAEILSEDTWTYQMDVYDITFRALNANLTRQASIDVDNGTITQGLFGNVWIFKQFERP